MDNVTQQIDLNLATEDELSALPGIGLTLAKRIVAFRETVHPFEEVIELTAVPGISERMVQGFKDQVFVASALADDLETEEAGAKSESDEVATMEEAIAGEREMEPDIEMTPELDSVSAIEPGPELEPEPEEEIVPDEGEEQKTATLPEVQENHGAEYLVDAPSPPRREVEPEIIGRSGSPEVPEQTQAAPAPAPVPDQDQSARRRGCVVLLLGTVLGAIAGTILTLAIMAALNNGALSFSRADDQLVRGLNDARQKQADLIERLVSIESQLGELSARAGQTAEQQANAEQSLRVVQQDVASLEQDVFRLENASGEFEERLASVAEAAETFETFLDRLRDLLFDFQGPPPTPVPSPTATATMTPSPMPTATSGTEETATLEASPASTGMPTRTPRPTSTPFSLATGTPEPQP